MSTLLLRLASPLQSWGVSSKFNHRITERMPSKSAVVGILAAALGRKRNERMSDLYSLRFGVRIDNEGKLLRDYHTVKTESLHKKQKDHTASKDDILKGSYETYRYYLADAIFLVGLEGDISLLKKIEQALRFPVFPLFLGRRSCPPEGRLILGIREKVLVDALREEPWLASEYMQKKAPFKNTLRIFTDASENDQYAFYQRDVPISFNQEHRQFGFRRVAEQEPLVVSQHTNGYRASSDSQTNHNAFIEVEE